MAPMAWWANSVLHSLDHFMFSHVTELSGLTQHKSAWSDIGFFNRLFFWSPNYTHLLDTKIKNTPLKWMQHVYEILKEGTETIRNNHYVTLALTRLLKIFIEQVIRIIIQGVFEK